MTRKFIPVNEPLLGKSEKKYLLECINKNEVSSSGNFVKEFEKKFAEFDENMKKELEINVIPRTNYYNDNKQSSLGYSIII